MNDIQQKISEIEKQDRRSRIAYVIAGIMVVLSLVLLLIYSDFKRKANQKITEQNRELKEVNFAILEYQKKEKEFINIKLDIIDSLNVIATFKIDSIQKELNKLQNNRINYVALKSINSAEKDLKKISSEIKNAKISRGYRYIKSVSTDNPVLLSENRTYYIRMYSYNPEPKIKKSLIKTLQQQKYRVKVYPDWSKKPSFFSKSSTILYYSSKTKKAAEKLQMILKKSGFKFNILKGSGLGISEKEKENTFIIHYMK